MPYIICISCNCISYIHILFEFIYVVYIVFILFCCVLVLSDLDTFFVLNVPSPRQELPPGVPKCLGINEGHVIFGGKPGEIQSHTIHAWYIYLRLVDFYGKCR